MAENENSSKQFRPLLYSGLFAVVISLFFAFHYDPKLLGMKILFAAVAEFGFAAIIAYFIIHFVDYKEKLEFRSYIQRSERRLATKATLSYLLDMELPERISRELEDFIVSSKLVKTENRISYGLVEIEDENEWLYLTQDVEYVAYNASQEQLNHEIIYKIDLDRSIPSTFSEKGRVFEFTVERKRRGADRFETMKDISFEGKELVNDQENKFSGTMALEYMDEVRFHISSRRLKRKTDTELSYNAQLSNKVDIEFSFDQSKFDVNLIMLHPKRDEIDRRDGEGVSRWYFDYPLLPGNGIYIFWNQKTHETE